VPDPWGSKLPDLCWPWVASSSCGDAPWHSRPLKQWD